MATAARTRANSALEGGLGGQRFLIEEIYPVVDGGRFPVKRIAGQTVDVWADITRDGHDVTAAALLWRRADEPGWRRAPMLLHDNDRWTGSFQPTIPGRYTFAIEAWTDEFASWRHGVLIKRGAGQDIALDLRDGAKLIAGMEPRDPAARAALADALAAFEREGDPARLLSEEIVAIAAQAQARPDLTRTPGLPIVVDRAIARTGAWYEIFPRSQAAVPGRHGTFDDCVARLPDIAALGFDVLYFPPIHPIGHSRRKGRNNALVAAPGDPGSPYAIGAEGGGHDALHPELGTLADFRRLIDACSEYGLEVALDFAIQCSLDHPWLREHPQWFKRRADGSIRHAENPPKKYEDIVNPDLACADHEALWTALRDVILFWRDQGVRIFRVDNPHTKPFPFWEWLIAEVQRRDPEVVFLSEAFTRPKVMRALAKLGFSQSYTYFTWRTTKAEIETYLQELTQEAQREFFRPNFFVNTPDILPFHLQTGETWMFKSRVALAATLSASYGVYSGFELIEHEPIPGREEYLNSEKYELKVRDWHRPGNIRDYIARLNRLRKLNPALLQTNNLRFVQVDDEAVTGFVKEADEHDNAVAVAVALAGDRPREFWFHFGDLAIGPPDARRPISAVENLVTGERRPLEWGGVRLRIDPSDDPALLMRCLG
jgi:starch synthase (maltosyl-transferring)